MIRKVDPDVLAGFIEEVGGYLPAVRAGIAAYRAATDQAEALHEAYRHVHTVKGAASMVGLTELSHIAYHLEVALEDLANAGRPMTALEEELFTWTVLQIENYLDSARAGQVNANAIQDEVARRYRRLRGEVEAAGEPPAAPSPEPPPEEAASATADDLSFDAPWAGETVEDFGGIPEFALEPTSPDPVPLPEPLAEPGPSLAQQPGDGDLAADPDLPPFDSFPEELLPSWEPAAPVTPPRPSCQGHSPPPPPPRQETEGDLDEISPELVEVFALESQDHLRNISTLLPVLERDAGNREVIQSIRRSAHTLKGAAAMVGFRSITELAHRMEDMLDLLYDGQMAVTPDIVQLLFASTDALEDMAAGNVDRTRVHELYACFADLLGSAPAAAKDRSMAGLAPAARQAAPTVTAAVAEPAETDADEAAASLAAGTRRASQFVRIPIERLDELVKLVSELVITRSTFEQRMMDFVHQIGELRHSSDRLRNVAHRMETEFEASALAGGRTTALVGEARFNVGRGDVARRSMLSLQTHGFDELEFDRYTEFHLLSRALAETTNDIQTVAAELNHVIGDFDGYLNRQGRQSSEIEDKLMRLRMVPLSTLASRLHRTVRNVAEPMGKDVELVLEGEGTELDKTVLEAMADPLLHLLRNAVDHGIEPPELRQVKGKPARGVIRLRAFHEGNQVVIQIADDGAGVDPEHVRATAVRKGLLSATEAPTLSEGEVFGLLFVPGFSTARQISEVSGRGVGLDIVKAQVHKLKGIVTLESRPGQGARFTVRLPMTLAITRSLLIKAHQETFALPLDAVRQILRLDSEEMEHVGAEPVIRVGGKVYPVVFLGKVLGLRQPADESVRRPPIILVNTGVKDIALVVDRLLGGREVVIKNLGSHLRYVRGITGATLMGDGSVVLILNPAELAGSVVQTRALNRPRSDGATDSRCSSDLAGSQQGLSVLVVDDSPSVRRVVTNLLKGAGMSVTAAKDGLEALELLQQAPVLPDLCLLDIEMPRMDGYELLAALKSQDATRSVPVIMMTSRAGEKHRKKALDLGASNYLVKPYQDEALLTLIRQTVQESKQVTLA